MLCFYVCVFFYCFSVIRCEDVPFCASPFEQHRNQTFIIYKPSSRLLQKCKYIYIYLYQEKQTIAVLLFTCFLFLLLDLKLDNTFPIFVSYINQNLTNENIKIKQGKKTNKAFNYFYYSFD
jgi:hypothetical protein